MAQTTGAKPTIPVRDDTEYYSNVVDTEYHGTEKYNFITCGIDVAKNIGSFDQAEYLSSQQRGQVYHHEEPHKDNAVIIF